MDALDAAAQAIRRGAEELFLRLHGPMNFRIIVQPTVAALLAIRAGLKDERSGRWPYLKRMVSGDTVNRPGLREGWKDIGRVFILAVILDSVYQLKVHTGIYALELIVAAVLLVVTPYAVVRDLTARVVRGLGTNPRRGPTATS